ncbi:MAG: LNS2 domain-containing protein [Candidatus Polarisedimenticolia bacterium]
MVILIDIDGTICTEESPADRPLAQPLPGAREAVNRFVEAGHVVVLWTGRGWDQYRVTQRWLDDHGFKYTQILMGKPIANLIIDDRARRFEGWDKNYLPTVPSKPTPS